MDNNESINVVVEFNHSNFSVAVPNEVAKWGNDAIKGYLKEAYSAFVTTFDIAPESVDSYANLLANHNHLLANHNQLTLPFDVEQRDIDAQHEEEDTPPDFSDLSNY